MNEELFRKKSLDKVKSPESLNDYIRVSNPGVWLILAAVIALLAGACIWGIFGNIETTVKTTAVAENGSVVCVVDREEIGRIENGMTVKIGDAEGTVSDVDAADANCIVRINLPDGTYDAEIVIERIKPISFIFN